MKSKLTFLIGALLCISALGNAQNKLFVSINATGNNSGSSWTNAYTSLTTALAHADTVASIDTILIAAGTYVPEIRIPNNFDSRLKSFQIYRSNLTLLGGYQATTGVRNTNIYHSIISGEIGDTTSNHDNIRILMTISGTSLHPLTNINLDGLSFLNANNDVQASLNINNYTQSRSGSGGAIYSNHAAISINNCAFKNNRSYWVGGAIAAEYTKLNIKNSDFDSCVSNYGGAIFSLYQGSVFIDECTFLKNYSQTNGSCLLTESKINDSVAVTNSLFKYNREAILASYSSGLTISNNTFDSNTTRVNLFSISKQFTDTFPSLISHNIISNNTQTYNNGTMLHLVDNSSSSTSFHNNIVANNKLDYLFSLDGFASKHIDNNTFVQNTGRHYTAGANYIQVKNSIFAYNSHTIGNSFQSIKNSYVEGLSDTTNENIDATIFEPMFVKHDTVFEAANYRLQYCSPLINAGNTTGITATFDLDGYPRNLGTTIDLGAYEKQSNDLIASTATLATSTGNNIALQATCEENDWTYYTPLHAPDSIVFAIKWGNSNAIAKDAAKVTIQVDNTHTIVSNGNAGATATLPRYWNVDLNGNTVSGAVAVRFYYSDTEIAAMQNALNTTGYDSISTIKWFMMPTSFDPTTHVSFNNINNGNFTPLSSAGFPINTIQYVEFDNLSTIVSGTGYLSAYKKTTSISNNEFLSGLTLAPNPTTNMLNIQVLNQAFIGQKASLVDIHGRVLHSFELKANNQLDCSQLATGVYLIQVGSNNAAKFVKQ